MVKAGSPIMVGVSSEKREAFIDILNVGEYTSGNSVKVAKDKT